MPKKHLYFYFALAGILLLILGVLIFSLSSSDSPTHKATPDATPTPVTPDSRQSTTNSRTTPAAKPPVEYHQEQSEKMVDMVKNRRPLSSTDASARSAIIASLGGNSGYISQTPSYRLEYVKTADLFMVEIMTTDIARAKREATALLTQRGLSLEGICTLPVVFYLNYQAANQLRNQNITFNPLPEGC